MRKLRLFGREAGRQILGNRVELGVRGLGAIIGHLVDQGLPAGGVQALLGGNFREWHWAQTRTITSRPAPAGNALKSSWARAGLAVSTSRAKREEVRSMT